LGLKSKATQRALLLMMASLIAQGKFGLMKESLVFIKELHQICYEFFRQVGFSFYVMKVFY
jgi:hypothetical protein